MVWGGLVPSGAQAQARNVALDEAGLVNQRFQVTLLTKQAFFDAVAAAELERVGEARVRSAAEQLKIAKDKLAAGSAIRSDTLRSTVAYGQAQLALLNARAQRATAEASLARLIGVDGIVSAVVDPSIMTMSALDTAAIRAEALQNAPSIAQADAASRAASAQVNVSRSQYFPTVTASYSNSRTGTDLGALTPSWQAGLSLSWPLFNNFARETALSAAQAQVAIALASQDADDEDLRVQRERYRLGAATIVDVLTAQANLDQTQVDAVNARRAYQLAQANLETLLGRKL